VAAVIARGTGVWSSADAQVGAVKSPRKIKDATPEYPAKSLQAGDEGVVILELTIDIAGSSQMRASSGRSAPC
jgi:outer membrane biosynthesis protein TonB